MMLFWIVALALTAIVGGFIALAFVRGRETHATSASYDLQVYRDQLKDVEKDLARGVIAEADAERIRTEIARRILAADAQLQQERDVHKNGAGVGRGAALLCGVFLLAGGFSLYWTLGAPGYEDQPLSLRIEQAQNTLASRASQSAFEAQLPPRDAPNVDPDFLQLMNELRGKVKERPDDLQGHQLLARNEGTLGNYKAAYQAQKRVIDLKGAKATGTDYTQLADLMIRAAQGYISPEADTALRKALELNPNDGFARYYVGLMMTQNGRPDMTFRLWRDLLEQGPENAPWIAPIRARIEDLAWLAGVDYTVPAVGTLPGPSADDIQAAEGLTAQERAGMIQSMVQGLSDRLATEGGTPEEWARLIAAYGVLGEVQRANDILAEAQTVFANNAEALATINAAATGLNAE